MKTVGGAAKFAKYPCSCSFIDNRTEQMSMADYLYYNIVDHLLVVLASQLDEQGYYIIR
jgi:hypothetical protein